MLPFVLIALGLIAGIVGVVMLIAIARGAFSDAGARDYADTADIFPPFVSGEPLQLWAEALARRTTRRQLTADQARDWPLRLASRIEERVSRALLPLARTADVERVVPCPEAGQGQVGVTAPEAFAIARRLREQCSRRELQRIRELAVENAHALAAAECGNSPAPALRCPLVGKGNVCSTYRDRPLRCRALHARIIAQHVPPDEEFEETITAGFERGVTGALDEAHRDGKVYELNSALAATLAYRDPVRRWTSGVDIFAECRPIGPLAGRRSS